MSEKRFGVPLPAQRGTFWNGGRHRTLGFALAPWYSGAGVLYHIELDPADFYGLGDYSIK